jgi:phage shock protein C
MIRERGNGSILKTQGKKMTNEHTAEQPRRLYKSRHDRLIDGVCGGIGEYFGVEVTIIRIIWVLTILFGGWGIFLYLAAMIIMPVNPEHIAQQHSGEMRKIKTGNARVWGLILVSIGLLFLINNFGWFAFYRFWDISWSVIFPIMIILFGMALIYSQQQARRREDSDMDDQAQNVSYKKLYKSRTDRKLFGVCGGLGAYFTVDPTIVRIVFVGLAILSVGAGIVLYLAMAIFIPNEPLYQQQ